MRLLSVVLALAVSAPSWAQEYDGGVPLALPSADAGCDATAFAWPDGSRLVPAASWQCLGQREARCDAERSAAVAAPASPPSSVLWVVVALAVGVGAGAALGYALHK